MKLFKHVLWALILAGPFLGHLFTVASLLLSISYIVYLLENRKSYVESSDYWEDLTMYWHECYTNLVESHPDDAQKEIESYQIKELLRKVKYEQST